VGDVRFDIKPKVSWRIARARFVGPLPLYPHSKGGSSTGTPVRGSSLR
jgi:hypothetical protein